MTTSLPARPLDRDTTEPKPKPSKARTFLILALTVVLAIGAFVGMRALVGSVDSAATAEGGYDYSAETYSVLFPGEPEISSQEVPDIGVSMEMALWENSQKFYMASSVPQRREGLTLDESLNGSVQESGAMLVESQEVAVDGGSAVLARSTLEDETFWTLIVFSDAGGLFILAHSGEEKDKAFFQSLRFL